jgi:hypothetical protein
VSLNVQAGASLATLAEEIVDPVASRVFARSTFAYGHDPETPVVEPATFAVTVLQPALAVAAVVPFPPQAVRRNPAAASRAALRVM